MKVKKKKNLNTEIRFNGEALRVAISRLKLALLTPKISPQVEIHFDCRDGWAWIGFHSGGRAAWVHIAESFDFAPFFIAFGDVERMAHRFCFTQDLASGNVFIDGRKCGIVSDDAEMLLPQPVAKLDYGLFYGFVLRTEEALSSRPGRCFVGIRDGQIVVHDHATLIWALDFPMQTHEPGFDFCEFTVEEIKATSSLTGDVRVVRLGSKCGLMFDDLIFLRNPVGILSTERLATLKIHSASFVIGTERIANAIKRARREYKHEGVMRLWLTLAECWLLENEAGKVLAEGKCSSMSVGAKPVRVLLDGFRLERALRHLGFYQPAAFRLADFGSLSNIVAISPETFGRQTVFVCPLYDDGEV
ncbi:MAG: hypothetical protein RMJ33_14665 [Saprospiraceae bacterium]|nr:hypothetical protein [Saprospiraceae bacterium]MDW8231072.1 hypothetical protein [Saprospiraceae bacterium]